MWLLQEAEVNKMSRREKEVLSFGQVAIVQDQWLVRLALAMRNAALRPRQEQTRCRGPNVCINKCVFSEFRAPFMIQN